MKSRFYKIDLATQTVLTKKGESGEVHDLNAEGEPIETREEFLSFIDELARQGAFGSEMCLALKGHIENNISYWLVDIVPTG